MGRQGYRVVIAKTSKTVIVMIIVVFLTVLRVTLNHTSIVAIPFNPKTTVDLHSDKVRREGGPW